MFDETHSLWETIMGWFSRKPAEATTPADVRMGAQPGASYGARLGEDERVVAAMNRKREAAELAPTLPSPATMAPPLVREIEAPPEDWTTYTFILQPGNVVQILGRAPHRQEFAVRNETGAAAPVYLFQSQTDADRFVNTAVKPRQGRFLVVKDPAVPREGKHSAGMWAAVHPTDAEAMIDVTASVYRGPRP